MKKEYSMNENSARRAAWKWFEKHGFEDHAGLVLHHKDTSMKSRNYKRYAQWRHGDLVPMTVQEHRRLHMKLEQSRRTRTKAHNGRISEGVKNAERGRTILISRSETLEFRTMA